MRAPALLVLSLTAATALQACKGIPEHEFVPKYERRYCRAVKRCSTSEMLRVVNVEECLHWFVAQEYPDPSDCPYDPVAAQTCLDDLHLVACQTEPGADERDPDPVFPESCEAVYDACAYPRPPRITEPQGPGGD